MKTLLAVVFVSLVMGLSLAWTLRYHIVVGNDPLTVYSIDRWTGEVSLIAPEPAVRSLTSQSLEFVRAPLVRLRDTAYRDQLMESFRREPDAGGQSPAESRADDDGQRGGDSAG